MLKTYKVLLEHSFAYQYIMNEMTTDFCFSIYAQIWMCLWVIIMVKDHIHTPSSQI